MKTPPIRIAPAIRLRKEYFGGLIYDSRTGYTLEIDKEAFRMLSLMKDKAVNPDALSAFLIENKITKSPIDRLARIGFRRMALLRYKPPASSRRWQAERPTTQQMKRLHGKIERIVQHNPELNLRVDCALSFVQRHLPSELAARLGIKGCVAADRIPALAPDGSAYPCSQLVHPQCNGGNLLETAPEELWDKSKILRRYRSFDTQKTFTQSQCGVCLKKNACGGCRVFAEDGSGGDPGCPEPILPSLTLLGENGRSVDLAEYFKKSGSLSVGEYMDRYGVGQKTSIKELHASPYAVCTSDKRARKKTDRFISAHLDSISDIQDSIGYTGWDFPYATSEDIEEWLKESDYPAWIKK